jgi:uncharacterized protein (TIGR00369 family)
MDQTSLSGLALLQAAMDGKVPLAPIAQTMPMRLTAVAPGRINMEVEADDRHINPLGGVHGGFAATVLDSVTGCAVHTLLEAGIGYGTVDLHVKMLRPVPKNRPLAAEGRVLHLSRTLGVAEGEIRDADGKLVAHATCSCIIFRPD